jgi:predicted membrane channel-forming protein YqfA (hemolysin III family)
MSPAPSPAPRKHLMQPGQPRPVARREPMSLSTVQRWVMSTLALITVAHFAAGLVLAAVFSDRPDARVGLLVIAGVMGVLGVAAALVIHGRKPVSPWLAAGVLPAVVGAFFVF